VLWSLRTNHSQATRATQADVILPSEVHLGAARVTQFNEADQQEARELDTNLLEEECNLALANIYKYQESLWHHYNKGVVPQTLEVDGLVLKKDIRTIDKHKFSPWEGPYIIVEITVLGVYVLAEINGDILKNTWNMDQLRKSLQEIGKGSSI
jgi:hypothetical protein